MAFALRTVSMVVRLGFRLVRAGIKIWLCGEHSTWVQSSRQRARMLHWALLSVPLVCASGGARQPGDVDKGDRQSC